MIKLVISYNLRPEKREAYQEWALSAIKRMLAVPGIKEAVGYRPITGSKEVVVCYSFDDMAAFAQWYEHPDMQRLKVEARCYEEDVTYELWGPSPLLPMPAQSE